MIRLLFAALYFAACLHGAIAETPSDGEHVFSDRVFFPPWLARLSGSLLVTADVIEIGESRFEDMHMPVHLNDQQLSVEEATIKLGGGAATLTFNHRFNDGASRIQFRARDVRAEAITVIEQAMLSAPVDLNVQLSGRGRSAHQIMRTASGSIEFSAGRGEIDRTAIDQAGANILSLVVGKLNPFIHSTDRAELVCAKARFPVSDGLIDSNPIVGVQTSQLQLLCGGRVRFADETIAVSCMPRRSDGRQLGVGKLVEAINIGGTLTNPHLMVDKAGLLRQSAVLGARLTEFRLPAIGQLLGGRREDICDLMLDPKPSG